MSDLIKTPIQSITGIWKFFRQPFHSCHARSLPGHLLHLILEGEYHLTTNGRQYDVRQNDIIYYHETEEVFVKLDEHPVAFYSIGFLAPDFPPLPIDRRVFPASERIINVFHSLFEKYHECHNIRQKHLGIMGDLHQILYYIMDHIEDTEGGELKPNTWWNLEQQIRERRQFHVSLDELADLAHSSRSTVVRECRKACDQSPIQRLRQIRMEEAKGLLRYSDLSVSQVADYLQYPRIHEFSREFKKSTGESPIEFRKQKVLPK